MPLVVFTTALDWDAFLSQDHESDIQLLRRLSATAERAFDLVRLHFCRFDLPDTLPGNVGSWAGSEAFLGAMIYTLSDHESYLIAGEAIDCLVRLRAATYYRRDFLRMAGAVAMAPIVRGQVPERPEARTTTAAAVTFGRQTESTLNERGVPVRAAVLYDIHGNLPALEAVLAEVRNVGVDRIIVGGDVIPGPMHRETLTLLLGLEVSVQFIYGNGEPAVLAQMAAGDSKAVTRMPAATSASESRRASCSAARSASSSQSPGSSGRSSISVPSGRSVASSTSSRPARTRALIVMRDSVALDGAAQQIKDFCRASPRAATKSGVELNPTRAFGFSMGFTGRLWGRSMERLRTLCLASGADSRI
jgi:hypothetical protein